MTEPRSSGEVESDADSEAGESETLAESATLQPRADSEAEPELDAPSDDGESETPAESATTQPPVEAEADTAAVAAPTAVSAGAEPAVAVEDTMPEESPTTRQRAARAPAWAWVAITLMALLLTTGLITLAVARNANPSTPEAVEDAQTLIAELEALNGYLATTNQLMSNAITSAEQLSASAQTKLAGLSEKLADAEPRVGQARALLGDQLSGTTRSELDKVQQQLQSQRLTLTQRTERLEEQLLATIGGAVAGLDDRVGVATGQGSGRASASEARIAALEGKQGETDESRAQLQAGAELLRAAVQAQRAAIQAQREAIQAQREDIQALRERAQDLAAQIRQLRRTVAVLRRIVDRLSSRP